MEGVPSAITPVRPGSHMPLYSVPFAAAFCGRMTTKPRPCKLPPVTHKVPSSPSEISPAALEPSRQAHLIEFSSDIGGSSIESSTCPDASSGTLYPRDSDAVSSNLPVVAGG